MSNFDPDVKKWLIGVLGDIYSLNKHEHSHQDDVYKIKTANTVYYVKSSINLRSEYENLVKLQAVLNVPKVISYNSINKKDYLIICELPGRNLVQLKGIWNDIEIVNKFAEAVRKLHKIDATKVYPDAKSSDVLSHGDMALPNIIIADNDDIGYIDFGQLSYGTPELDIYDSIWSLQRNLGPGYGELFIEKYGPVKRTPKINEILKYRHQQSAENKEDLRK